MITGAVGWLWALGVFAVAFFGVIMSVMLVKAGTALEEKEEEVKAYRHRPAREHAPASTPAPAVAPSSSPVMPSDTRPVSPPSSPGASSGISHESNTGFKTGQ